MMGCEFAGCMEPTAAEIIRLATVDDGSCEFDVTFQRAWGFERRRHSGHAGSVVFVVVVWF